ncbi:predicted protein [Thalassiosira pseudonana CCMP1335]|uniref:Uncharacterized protein n=1 Tax=Thalassiosira pseudonana TaxID=35128 RepID=B8C2K3_THAPS|nr:predicted protein [Thalassiosira pseudonana CCMP1335]EED91963.1 predicted protein [Thalassiosira pseudonana CCMP1335]
MVAAPNKSPSWTSIPVRLLSSVAVVGRDNEPIYLRGGLCSDGASSTSASSPAGSPNNVEGDGLDADAAMDANVDEDNTDSGETGKQGRGLFGRIKGAIAKDASDGKDKVATQQTTDDEDDDTDDPFGFFGSASTSSVNDTNSSGSLASMSLTQQLVLHASLDRFEEMATSSSKGGTIRWRTPGSTGANAMWMGLLCEVEERWTVYGYLTNTGIKFMILVENIHLNEDGRRQELASTSNLSPNPLNRESDLKIMFWLKLVSMISLIPLPLFPGTTP